MRCLRNSDDGGIEMKRLLSALLCVMLLCGTIGACAAETSAVFSDTAQTVLRTVPSPTFASIGGDWAVLALARGGCAVPANYYRDYYRTIEETVSACGGVLHATKHTEYARLILALRAIGKDPQSVSGYNLLLPLGDFDKTVVQGTNGAAFALIALDCGNYDVPQNASAVRQATRAQYIDYLLARQLPGGGFALGGTAADVDVTAMVLCALAPYRTEDAVTQAVARALTALSEMQQPSGGFVSRNVENAESVAQVVIALTTLGIPLDDARFIKDGNSVVDALLRYYHAERGFLHTQDATGAAQMATEQGFCALVAIERAKQGLPALYDMRDAEDLVGEDAEIATTPETTLPFPEKTFADIATHQSRAAIEALAARGILSGRAEDAFMPDETMSRAEFAKVIVGALGLAPGGDCSFTDLGAAAWAAPYVAAVSRFGLMHGQSETAFAPMQPLTREEAAVIAARAAALCGMDTAFPTEAARTVLAGFSDYVKASDWAYSALAFCYGNNLYPSDALTIRPKDAATRAELAQMLWNLMQEAGLSGT